MTLVKNSEIEQIKETAIKGKTYRTYVDKELQLVPGYSPSISWYTEWYAPACNLQTTKEEKGDFLRDELGNSWLTEPKLIPICPEIK